MLKRILNLLSWPRVLLRHMPLKFMSLKPVLLAWLLWLGSCIAPAYA
ncbi:hypothetical protein [Methylobacillus glycogenes]|nr:hypothetical protein [Methylobacillus glycogenes]